MYTLKSAIVTPVGGIGQWHPLDIGELTFATLFTEYSHIFTTLTNPFIEGDVNIDLITLKNQIGYSELTVNAFLIANGNNTLPNTNPALPATNKFVRYADGFHAGYKVKPVNPFVGSGVPQLASAKNWLELTKSGVDYNDFYKYCLVSVNGFFHQTDTDGQRALVNDGMTSAIMSGENKVGIYSFRDIGEMYFIPITDSMIYKTNQTIDLVDSCYLNVNEDLSNKTVMLVLGGYLHALDHKVFYQVSEDTFGINFKGIPLLERYYESKNYIDLSALEITNLLNDNHVVNKPQFFNDHTLTEYLTLSQSFLVVIDAKDVFVDTTPLHKTHFPNAFITTEVPRFPLITGYGKVSEYWYTYEDTQYSITCESSLKPQYNFQTVDNAVNVSDIRNSIIPTRQSDAFFLKIGKLF